jgi:hypothetical protein
MVKPIATQDMPTQGLILSPVNIPYMLHSVTKILDRSFVAKNNSEEAEAPEKKEHLRVGSC